MASKAHKSRSRLMCSLKNRLVAGKSVKNRVIFEIVAAELGVPWDGTKAHGYTLANMYAGRNGMVRAKLPEQPKQSPIPVAGKDFLETYAWRSLRMRVITKRGARCECCGATPKDGVRMHVDHIKPRVKFPELALEESNLQILCEVCNHGKGNWDQTDWRADKPVAPAPPPPKPQPNSILNVVARDMRPRLVKKGA